MTFISSQVDRKLNRFASVFRDYPFLAEERHECAVDNADVHFIFEQVGKVPDPIKRVVLNNAFKIKVRQERNLYILRTTKLITGLLPEKLRDSLTVDDDEIRAIAQDCADRCRRLALLHQSKSFCALKGEASSFSLTKRSSCYGYNAMYPLTCQDTFYRSLITNGCTRYENRPMYPLTGTSFEARSCYVTAVTDYSPKTTEFFGHDTALLPEHTEPFSGICQPNEGEIYRTLTKNVTSYQIKPIEVSVGSVTQIGAIKRMCDKHWWYRRLRKLFNQAY